MPARMSWLGRVAGAAVLCLSLVSTASAANIETVPVGNRGNAPDATGFGAVDYNYRIGVCEVTAGQYTEFLNAVAATDPYWLYDTQMSSGGSGCQIQRLGSPGSYAYTVAPDWENRPVNFVSWGDAARFANWLHNGQPTDPQGPGTTETGSYTLNGAVSDADLRWIPRNPSATWVIPSENEWYKAAYYDPAAGIYYKYPTGSDTMPGFVTSGGVLSTTGDPFIEGGVDLGNYATHNEDAGVQGIGGPYYRTEVGEWENSASPYGTFDQGGNLWEWNEAMLYNLYRGIRGGTYHDKSYRMMSTDSAVSSPSSGYMDVGFRVGQIPEPATMGLLVLGGLAVLRRHKA